MRGELHILIKEEVPRVLQWHRRCFAALGQLRKEVPPMDAQTVIALCAVFSVVLGIVGISQRHK